MTCELPSISSAEWRGARKEHKCCECHEAINPGTRYWIFNGKYEGRWETYRRCQMCSAVYDALCAELDPWQIEEIAFGDLIEAWRETR